MPAASTARSIQVGSDLWGWVGMKPRAIYIMLPVEPSDDIDRDLGGAGYPNKDETVTNDGWAVINETSAPSL